MHLLAHLWLEPVHHSPDGAKVCSQGREPLGRIRNTPHCSPEGAADKSAAPSGLTKISAGSSVQGLTPLAKSALGPLRGWQIAMETAGTPAVTLSC